ncbi:hypothetical protein ACFQX7_26240 [Luedemannella flava]
MATVLYRLGRASYRRRGLVVIVWLVVLAALGGSAAAFKGATSSDFTMPGTESQRAIDALKRSSPRRAARPARSWWPPRRVSSSPPRLPGGGGRPGR